VLPRIRVPTLLLCGEEDGRAAREVWEALHATIRRSELVTIPDGGHMIDIETGERVNAAAQSVFANSQLSAPRIRAPTAQCRYWSGPLHSKAMCLLDWPDRSQRKPNPSA
jgi:hypothetical protein